jgi:hypothetical protein
LVHPVELVSAYQEAEPLERLNHRSVVRRVAAGFPPGAVPILPLSSLAASGCFQTSPRSPTGSPSRSRRVK